MGVTDSRVSWTITYADVDYYIHPAYDTPTSSYAYYVDFGSGVTTTLLPIIGNGIASHHQFYALFK